MIPRREFPPGRPSQSWRMQPEWLLAVLAHPCAQKADLPSEARPRRADRQVKLQRRPLPERQVGILLARDEARRVLAADEVTQRLADASHRSGSIVVSLVPAPSPANQLRSRHSRSDIRAR